MREEFDRLSKQLMREAQSMPWFERVSDLVREIAVAITELRRWSEASVIEIYTHFSRYGINDPFGYARTQLHRSLAEMELYTTYCPKNHRNLVTYERKKIWDALNGQILQAHEIAPFITSQSEDSVRQMISAMERRLED